MLYFSFSVQIFYTRIVKYPHFPSDPCGNSSYFHYIEKWKGGGGGGGGGGVCLYGFGGGGGGVFCCLGFLVWWGGGGGVCLGGGVVLLGRIGGIGRMVRLCIWDGYVEICVWGEFLVCFG